LDNLTHSLVGLFIARAGFRRLTPRASILAIVAANSPDFDVIGWFVDRPTWMHWHRNITHSLIAIPVMAAFSLFVVRFAGRKQLRWGPAALLALIAGSSHLVLDLTNVYAVRLMLPFSGEWFSWDLTPVVDLVIWAILLLVGLAAPELAKLVSGEIGEKQKAYRGTGAAIAALLLLATYDGARAYFHQQAVDALNSQPLTQEQPRRVAAWPKASPLLWTGVEELSASYASINIDLRESRLHLNELHVIDKAESIPAMDAARRERPFQVLSEFVRYPLWTVAPAPDDPDAKQVTLLDLRFGGPTSPGFASATAIVDVQNRVKATSFGGGPPVGPPR
jgi:inner membrane protein